MKPILRILPLAGVVSLLSFTPLYSCKEEAVITESTQLPAGSTAFKIKVDTLASGLEQPWGMAFLPDGRVLITEKSGTIRMYANGALQPQTISGVPKVYDNGQGGLLDIQLHPDYAQNGWIYFTYAKPGSGGGSTTLARAKLEGNALTGMQELLVVKPFISSGVHFGSRIAFDGKGYVYFSTGERGTKANAQSLQTHNGKVLRLHDDGRVPTDNPFVGMAGALPEIWSYGHRNAQGLVYDAATETLYNHEHGPRGGDEINVVLKGANYGWPITTHGIDYNGSIISNEKEKEGIEKAIKIWVPSIAPCGMALVTGDKYPGWKGSLLVGALAGQHIARVAVKDRKAVSEEKLLEGIGRVRALKEAPDGFIYVLTENPGYFLRLTPEG